MAISAHITCNTDAHYTPVEYVESARRVLIVIDLDPASSAEANEIVRAQTFYTVEDDGLSLPWFGRVFLNPPGDPRGHLVRKFWVRACEHVRNGGVVLWVGFNLQQLQSLQRGLERSAALTLGDGAPCPHPFDFPRVVLSKRAKWRKPLAVQLAEQAAVEGGGKKKSNSPPHGNYFCLLGGDEAMRRRFRAEFGQYGEYVSPRPRKAPPRDLAAEILAALTEQPAPSKAAIVRRIQARKTDVIHTLDALVAQGSVQHYNGVFAVPRPGEQQ